MTPEDKPCESRERLEEKLAHSEMTIRSLEEQLGGIKETLGSVMEILRTMYPDAYADIMKKRSEPEQ